MTNNDHLHAWGSWKHSEEFHAPVRYCQECGEGQSAFAWQSVRSLSISPATRDGDSYQSKAIVLKLMASLKNAKATGNFGPELQNGIMAVINDQNHQMFLMNNPDIMEELGAYLNELGAFDTGRPQLNIGDYYRDGDGKYNLRWEISPSISLPISFEDLDRETQFYVLFNEWSRREAQGSSARNSGQIDEAEEIFQECLERAKQIDVPELEARSYEGLMTVAQKRGNRKDEKKWLKSAQEARSRQL